MKKRIFSILVLCCLVLLLIPATAVTASADTSGDWEYTVSSGVATITGYNGTATNVVIPDMIGYYQVTAIGESAFAGNATMTSVTFPAGLITIGNRAFSGCVGLTSVTLPAKLASLGERSFENCTRLTKITIKCTNLADIKNTYGVNQQPFFCAGSAGSGIAVVFADGCTRIPNDLFYAYSGNGYAANITSVTMADSVKSVGARAFAGCIYLKEVDFGDGVETIAVDAFKSCTALTDIDLSSTLTSIGESAFSGCSSLRNVSFPASLTTIGNYAFSGCVGFTNITLPTKLASLGERSFQNCTRVSKITIKSLSLGNITNTYGVNGQPFYCVGTATDGVEVVFSSGVTRIPTNLFHAISGSGYAANIVSVTIPKTVTSISSYAFTGSNTLKTVTMGNGVTSVGEHAFENCTALTTVTYSTVLDSVANYAFSGCTSLKSSTLPSSLTSIGEYAFQGCTGFTSLTLPTKLANLGARAFQNCTKITKITVNSKAINDISNEYGVNGQPFYSVGSATNGVTVIFSEGVTRIPARMFYAYNGESYAANLKYVQIPSTVTLVGASAFRDCVELKNIRFDGSAPSFGDEYVFSGVSSVAYHGGWASDALKPYGGDISWIRQPSTAKVKAGKTATIKLTTEATGLKYQWQYRTSSSGTWKSATATGNKTATLKVSATIAKTGYQYRCKVTDADGNVSYSKAATLYVLGIKTQPTTQKVKDGTTAKFTVAATGHNKTYQWQYKTSSSGSWKNTTATGAKTATLKVSATTGKSGYYYRCKVKDSAGNVVYTDAVRLYVLGIKTQPTTQKVKAGTTAAFTVSATGSGRTYQWQYKTSSSGTWKSTTATGAKTATLKVSATTGKSSYYYRCRVTDSAGNVVYTDAARLYVLGITSQPTSKTVSAGSTAKFTVTATGHSKTYQWQYRTSSSGTWKNTAVTGSKTDTLTTTGTAAKNGYQYRCRVTDSAGNVIYSNVVTLKVK